MFETNHCFIAEDTETSKVIGYIFGTTDTVALEKKFIRTMVPKIILHLSIHTLWHDLPSAILVGKYFLNMIVQFAPVGLDHKYPAHFHINILPGHQGEGIGKKLLSAFETMIRSERIQGMHITTTSANKDAIGFYKHLGYNVVMKAGTTIWGKSDVERIIMVKSLS